MKKIGVWMTVVLVLAACADSTPQVDIYKALEAVVASEKQFSKQQQPLVELEKKEKKKYDEIISLGMKEHKQIQRLSDEALSIVDERKERIEEEQKSMEASKEKFKEAVELIKKLDKESYKKDAESLIVLMNKRYDSYDALHHQYQKAVQLDRELYEMFKKDDVKLDELEKQITAINESYEQIMKANKEFNELTKEYNDTKAALYKKAGLEVVKDGQEKSGQ
jgi:tRNA U34 5-carboxymethylaminomethyl modifying GTPase MnmE/TrmE